MYSVRIPVGPKAGAGLAFSEFAADADPPGPEDPESGANGFGVAESRGAETVASPCRKVMKFGFASLFVDDVCMMCLCCVCVFVCLIA